MKRVLLILAFLLMIISCNSPEKNPQFSESQNITTKYTELKKIISTEVDDTFYVYIRVPKNYTDKKDNYPVLYLLDGDIDFNMATSIVRYLQYGKEAPDLIIVGIGYGTMMDDSEQNFRKRDYTFTKIDKLEQSGGADKFLCFLSKELIPFIDKNYRTTEKRILNGYSLGGLFTIYASLKENNLFDSYIIGSPYIKNNLDSLISLAENYSDFKSKIFITVGEKEDDENFHAPIKKMFNQFKNIAADKNNIKFTEFKNGSHFTCPSEALTYGLQYVLSEN